jgi:hypothetical protein
VSKVTQDKEFIVKGTLDDRVSSLTEAFERTYGKAFSSCAVNVLRNKPAVERYKVAVPGILVKNKTAIVTLAFPYASVLGKKRGPGQKTLIREVSIHSAMEIPACD